MQAMEVYLHFSCHRGKKRIEMGMSTRQNQDYVPLQLPHKQIMVESATLHPVPKNAA